MTELGSRGCEEQQRDIQLDTSHGQHAPGLMQGPGPFNTFGNGLGDATKCPISTFTDCTKLEGVVNTSDSCGAMQRDTSRAGKWMYKDLMKFKKRNAKSCTLERNNPKHQYVL